MSPLLWLVLGCVISAVYVRLMMKLPGTVTRSDSAFGYAMLPYAVPGLALVSAVPFGMLEAWTIMAVFLGVGTLGTVLLWLRLR